MLNLLASLCLVDYDEAHTPYPGGDLSYYWRGINYAPFSADFDIRYKGQQTTNLNFGWFVQFQVNNGFWYPLSGFYAGAYRYPFPARGQGSINFATHITAPIGKDYLLVTFAVENNSPEPATINISAWADVQILDNDKATVSWYGLPEKRGITMTDSRTNTKLTIVARNGYGVENVDCFWFGEFEGYINQYHELENRESLDPTNDIDTAFSLGWKDRVLYPGDKKNFSVLFGVGEDLKDPPIVTLNTEIDSNVNRGQHIKLNGNVKDFTYNEAVNLTVEFNGQIIKQIPYPAVRNAGVNQDWEVEFDAPSYIGKFPLTIYAIDAYGLRSNTISEFIRVNEPPVIQLTTDSIKSEYVTGGVVEIRGTIWDDTSAKIYYRFDNDYNFSIPQEFNCTKNTLQFRETFPLRESRLNYGDHTLYVWAVDEFGSRSNSIIERRFNYRQLHAPVLTIQNPTDAVYEVGSIIAINGTVYDQDNNERLTIWYKSPTSDVLAEFETAEVIPEIIVSETTTNFTFNVQIPMDAEIGKELKYIFQARDSNNGVSRDAYFTFNATLIKPPHVTEPPTFQYPSNYLKPGEQAKPDHYTFTSAYTSYTYINAPVGEGYEPYSTWSVTSTYLTIQSENPQRTPAPTEIPTKSPAPFVPSGEGINAGNIRISEDDKTKDEKFNWIPVVVGAAAVALVAILIAVIIIVIEAKKKAKEFDFNQEEAGTVKDDMDIEIENENSLYNKGLTDDPWANDFEDTQEHMFPKDN